MACPTPAMLRVDSGFFNVPFGYQSFYFGQLAIWRPDVESQRSGPKSATNMQRLLEVKKKASIFYIIR